jgi:hypothetical protein
MTTLAAAVLAFESVVVFLAIPVAVSVEDVSAGRAWPVGLALAVLCIVAAAVARRPRGLVLGWVVQGLVVASGLVVPAMFLVGGLFVFLWVVALRVGRRGDRVAASHRSPSG